jgi:hypothetical protein
MVTPSTTAVFAGIAATLSQWAVAALIFAGTLWGCVRGRPRQRSFGRKLKPPVIDDRGDR